MARVDTCPTNLTQVIESSTRLGCDKDEYGNDQYICLPTVNMSSLVEFCYNGIMGYHEKGIFWHFISRIVCLFHKLFIIHITGLN